MPSQLAHLGLQPLGDSFRPTGEAYMVALEQELGAPLPDDYRVFLGTYGVCTFSFDVAFQLPGGEWVDVNMFLGNDPDDAYDLRQSWESLKEQTQQPLLPIATDPLGNAICIEVGPKSAGAVRFWDHETESAVWVAASFSAFLTHLKKAP